MTAAADILLVVAMLAAGGLVVALLAGWMDDSRESQR